MWKRSRNCLGFWMGLYPIFLPEYFWGVSLPCVLILEDITGSRKAHKTKNLHGCDCWAREVPLCNVQSPTAESPGWQISRICPHHSGCHSYIVTGMVPITPTGGNQRQTMQLHTLRVVFCNTENHVMQPGKALQLVAVQKKYKVWTTVHFLTSLQPQQEMLLAMVDVGFHKIHRP